MTHNKKTILQTSELTDYLRNLTYTSVRLRFMFTDETVVTLRINKVNRIEDDSKYNYSVYFGEALVTILQDDSLGQIGELFHREVPSVIFAETYLRNWF